jgi:uncharacterized membrane protein YkvA (DUF1232 family)
MYAQTQITHPLPQILSESPVGAFRRRRRIGQFRLSTLDIDRFNRLLADLGRRQEPLDCDQVVTAARVLSDDQAAEAAPPCILQRLRQAETVAQMLTDRDWQPANDAVSPAQQVLDYLRGHEDLIPDWLPRVGRLDDAIVVETAWPRLEGEVRSYLDFRRLRQIEAQLRGRDSQDFRFDRTDWEVARHAEAKLIAHRKRVRESSYVPAAHDLFRVH